jgi:hypothetical protein
MGLLGSAAALARGRVAAIFLSAALPLVPAYLVGGAIIYLAVARATAEPDLPRGEAFAERHALPPDAPAEERRNLLREAQEPGAPRRPTISLTLVAGLVFGGLAFLAGLFLAQAALFAIACGAAGPGSACASVAARFDALGRTLAAALALVALGCAAGGVPGVFAAFAFSLAGAVAMAEDIGGFPALHRSWELLKQVWPSQLALILFATAVEVLLTQALGRLLPEHVVLAHALLDAAVATIVLPLPVFASAVLYLRARSAVEGKPVEEVLQYIRRTSAPG